MSAFEPISEVLFRRQVPNPDLNYEGFTPSFSGNLAISIIFGVLWGFNLILCLHTKQRWFLFCWFFGLILECIGYAGRAWSAKDLNNSNAFAMQLLCITIAPRFILAGIYFLVSQVTVIHGEKFSLLKPKQYSFIFVTNDMIAIILQAVGGGIAINNTVQAKTGSNIVLAGLSIQIASIVFFQFFWYFFIYRIWKSYKTFGDSEFSPQYANIRARKIYIPYICAISLAVIFIFIRTCFKVARMSNNWSNPLSYSEIYSMILEALMMLLACTLLSIFHPGIIYGASKISFDTSFKPKFTRNSKSSDNKNLEEYTENEDIY